MERGKKSKKICEISSEKKELVDYTYLGIERELQPSKSQRTAWFRKMLSQVITILTFNSVIEHKPKFLFQIKV